MRPAAESVLAHLRQLGLSIATAESCTGGLVAGALTAVPGSSESVWGGFVTYHNEAKKALLGVTDALLESHGAVSAECVVAMAAGARRASGVGCTIAISGIAGPGGGTESKPVGTVWIATLVPDELGSPDSVVQEYHFPGDRDAVRSEAVDASLAQLLGQLTRVDRLGWVGLYFGKPAPVFPGVMSLDANIGDSNTLLTFWSCSYPSL